MPIYKEVVIKTKGLSNNRFHTILRVEDTVDTQGVFHPLVRIYAIIFVDLTTNPGMSRTGLEPVTKGLKGPCSAN